MSLSGARSRNCDSNGLRGATLEILISVFALVGALILADLRRLARSQLEISVRQYQLLEAIAKKLSPPAESK